MIDVVEIFHTEEIYLQTVVFAVFHKGVDEI